MNRKEKIILAFDSLNSANSPSMQSHINSIKKSFDINYEFIITTNYDSFKIIENYRNIVIFGIYPKWFSRINTINANVIHFIGDKFKINNSLPIEYLTRNYTENLIRKIYYKKPIPNIILVNNYKMLEDFRVALDKLNLDIAIQAIPSNITDNFNKKLIQEIKEFNNSNSEPICLYNSANPLSKYLLKFSDEKNFNNYLILNCPYDKKLKSNRKTFISSLLNYRASIYEYYSYYHGPLKAIFSRVIYPLRMSWNQSFKKFIKFDNFFTIFQNYLPIRLKNINQRWKPCTKLQLAIQLGLPLVTLPEESITQYAKTTNYPIIICRNSKEIIRVLKNYNWKKQINDCKKRKNESIKIYREIYNSVYLEAFNK